MPLRHTDHSPYATRIVTLNSGLTSVRLAGAQLP